MKIILKRAGNYLLLIFPIIFVTLQVLLKIDTKYFFLSNYDPAYSFLFNGLNLANGELGSGLAHFPGTPVQIYMAIIIRLGHLFRNAGIVTEDVLVHPEYYLSLASYGIILIIALTLYFSGWIIYKKTNNLAVSLAIQIIPMLSVTGLLFSSAIMCEPFLVIATMGIIAQISLYCFSGELYSNLKQMLYLSLFTAIGITTKIIFIPVVILPFLILKKRKWKIYFLLFTFIISALLLIPAYPDLHSYTDWIKILVTHKGIYGSGGSGFTDIPTLTLNLQHILFSDMLFFFIFLFVIIYLIAMLIPSLRDKTEEKIRKIVIGIFIVVLMQLIMIGKHYLPHYMIIPYSLIMFISVLILFGFKKPLFQHKYNQQINIVFVFVAGILLIIRFLGSFTFSPDLKNPSIETLEYLETLPADGQKIIIGSGSSPYKEMALYLGMAFSANSGSYQAILQKHYPGAYFYNEYLDRYCDWYNDYNLEEILSKQKTTYIFRKSKEDSIPVSMLNEITELKNRGLVDSFSLQYKNSIAHDYLYKIESDTAMLRKRFKNYESIRCNCEILDSIGTSFLATDGIHLFDKTFLRSSDFVHDGKYSVKLTPEMPYALDIKLKVNINDYIKSFVWRNASDKKGLIVLTDDVPNGIYRTGTVVMLNQDNWEKIVFNYKVPENFKGDEVHLYLWYNGNEVCYFDDFEIEIYRNRLAD